jgi:hypothetical protein
VGVKRGPTSPFILVGSVLVSYFPGLEETELSGCCLSFRRSLPIRFRDGYRQAELVARSRVVGRYPSSDPAARHFAFVTVKALGRSETEAASKAQEALALQKGLWNLFLRRYAPSTGDPRPLNHILPGPVQSLQLPDGEPVSWAAGIVAIGMGRGDGSLNTFVGVHSGLAMGTIHMLGSEEQRQRWLPGSSEPRMPRPTLR